MNWHELGEMILELVKYLTAIGVIVKMLSKWTVKPMIKQFEQSINKAITKQVQPIEALVVELREQNSHGGQERKEIRRLSRQNARILDKHEQRLDRHEERIIKLETKTEYGIQSVRYKEEYRGEQYD